MAGEQTSYNAIDSGKVANKEALYELIVKIRQYVDSNSSTPANLATVATTGDYDDLINKPTIPSYSAGTGISITNGVIACTVTDTNTTYTAGTGISISNGVISLNLTNANGVSY